MRYGRKGLLVGLMCGLVTGVALAQAQSGDYAAGEASGPKAELEAALGGAVFTGTYTRDGSPYVLQFGTDGSLKDNRERTGRWWANDQGEYCREWANGPMAGTSACLEVLIHGKRMAVYSGDEKVLAGELQRAGE